jgi:exodeoxyribonuclease VII large subunit
MPKMPPIVSTDYTNDNPPKKRATLSISQLNRQAKQLLEGQFPSVWVEGEISNLSRPSSGHWYFTLKDPNAQIRCAMFRTSNARLRFQVESGQQLMARAKLSLYEARGDYQLIVEHLEPAGDGALTLAFEALKNKLQQQGLFDPDHKQPIPTLPKHLAIITSPSGAAIHDILTVLARRFAGIAVTIIPTAVQGKGAAQEIAAAIQTANQLVAEGRCDFDVILTGRGGGSLEDLWAFNEEVVAWAIYNSRLPVVTAVGHEVDFTIADFVADVRAPTPSAAAELLSPDGDELLATFAGYEQRLQQNIHNQLHNQQQQLAWLQSRLRHPRSRLQQHYQRLDELELRLLNSWHNQHKQQQLGIELLGVRLTQQSPRHRLAQLKLKTDNLWRQLERQIRQQLERQQQRLKNSMHLLDTVSPLATLGRGYAIVSDAAGQIITDAATVEAGQPLTTRLAKGRLHSSVTATELE